MPKFKDLQVYVTDKKGKALEEYGVQKNSKANLASCFIESKSDTPFRISIKPNTAAFPRFPALQPVASWGSLTSAPTGALNLLLEEDPDDIYDYDQNYSYEEGLDALRRSLTSAPTQEDKDPFHLLATMRLDGRQKFEKQIIVWLDENDSRYDRYNEGMVVFKQRLIYDCEGNIRQSGWVFKDLGIDDMFSDLFSSMGIRGGEDEEDAVPVTAEDELVDAFLKLGERQLEDKPESKAGQIEITLERVIVKETKKGAWRGDKDASRGEKGAKSDLKDITHTVGREEVGMHTGPVDAIIYEPWPRSEEKVYAIFRFYYRSAKTLGRFGFAGFATGAQAPSATMKGELAASKLTGGSTLGKKARRCREDGEEEDTPAKAGRWELSMAVRRRPGGEQKATAKKQEVKSEEVKVKEMTAEDVRADEDEEL